MHSDPDVFWRRGQCGDCELLGFSRDETGGTAFVRVKPSEASAPRTPSLTDTEAIHITLLASG